MDCVNILNYVLRVVLWRSAWASLFDSDWVVTTSVSIIVLNWDRQDQYCWITSHHYTIDMLPVS